MRRKLLRLDRRRWNFFISRRPLSKCKNRLEVAQEPWFRLCSMIISSPSRSEESMVIEPGSADHEMNDTYEPYNSRKEQREEKCLGAGL